MNIKNSLKIPLLSEEIAKGHYPEYLLWIGCAGAYDDRYKKVIRSLITILNKAGIDFAVLGPEESCTGDPARRAGNEFLFQIQALSNVQLLNGYKVKKIITSCPHCYNTFKNEYTAFGGNYEVFHHSELIDTIIKSEQLGFIFDRSFDNKKITYHDSCYLGRSNHIYDSPRDIVISLKSELIEMKRHKSNGLCCGAGGGQMFKDAENGNKEIYTERTEEALKTNAEIIATACPFCLTMLSDGVKDMGYEKDMKVLDIVELVDQATKTEINKSEET